ncbi:hypothetical protein XENOCAPTIV_021921 [Xenoophorus captivus]|uniref:Uncharacterized protein n=1 Tax=Xenoophorus captivus TaxID=1517983 RepID=A0ABV0S8Y4_9TELE
MFTHLQQVQRDKRVTAESKGLLLMLSILPSRKKNSGHRNKGNQVAIQTCETPPLDGEVVKHSEDKGRGCKVSSKCVADGLICFLLLQTAMTVSSFALTQSSFCWDILAK